MIEVSRSCSRVASRSEHVTISSAAIDDFVSEIDIDELNASDFEETPLPGDYEAEQLAAFAFMQGAVNFSFWGDEKWTIDVEGEKYDGGMALYHALRTAVDKDGTLLIASSLEHLDRRDVEEIFKGNVEIPLLDERLLRLQKLGAAVVDLYDGSFLNILEDNRFDALAIVNALVERMPAVFEDSALYKGEVVHFYKRAQLAVADIAEMARFVDATPKIDRVAELSAMADYKIPQVLRHLGILRYDEGLSQNVDNLVELEAGCAEEVEIRANTVLAIDLAAEALSKYLEKPVYPAQLDRAAWIRGQQAKDGVKPYHRTRTTAY